MRNPWRHELDVIRAIDAEHGDQPPNRGIGLFVILPILAVLQGALLWAILR
jgi:hypothetical protein